MKLFTLLVFLPLISGYVLSQEKYNKDRKIYIPGQDSIMNFSVLNSSKKIKIETQKTYFWYENNRVSFNQGGFSGLLLDGEFTVQMSKTGKLITKGNFNNGLKQGEWKTWYENGNLKEISRWNDGLPDGETINYDTNGNIEKQLIYKEGKLIIPVNKEQAKKSRKVKEHKSQTADSLSVSSNK